MKILADFHHACLYESLAMLFEDRFGWELYRPIGMEWFETGIWQFERGMYGDAVARQYLAPWSSDTDAGDHTERRDDQHPERTHRMVTMEQARAIGIDVVLATLTENQRGWHRFAREIGAHYGFQAGNQGAANEWGLAEFALLSCTTPEVKPWMPHVYYHQEFDLGHYRFDWPPQERDYIGTWVQCLTSDSAESSRFRRLAAMTPELRWRYHGHCSNDGDPLYGGNMPRCADVAAKMRAARVGVHLKTWSDGYGHVIHNLFAIGKPVIATAGYYADKLAAPLFVDGVTSFDVQRRTDAETIEIVRRLVGDDDFHRQIGEAAAARFREVVSFDEDARAVRAMLDGVLSDRLVRA